MDIKQAASSFSELGHEIRLEILKLLVKAGPEGLPVSHLKDTLNCPSSTLSHHISRLCNVNIIKQIRVGRELRCHVQFLQLESMMDFLYEECCKYSTTPCCADIEDRSKYGKKKNADK